MLAFDPQTCTPISGQIMVRYQQSAASQEFALVVDDGEFYFTSTDGEKILVDLDPCSLK